MDFPKYCQDLASGNSILSYNNNYQNKHKQENKDTCNLKAESIVTNSNHSTSISQSNQNNSGDQANTNEDNNIFNYSLFSAILENQTTVPINYSSWLEFTTSTSIAAHNTHLNSTDNYPSIMLTNARSIINKFDEIQATIQVLSPDVAIICEFWIPKYLSNDDWTL